MIKSTRLLLFSIFFTDIVSNLLVYKTQLRKCFSFENLRAYKYLSKIMDGCFVSPHKIKYFLYFVKNACCAYVLGAVSIFCIYYECKMVICYLRLLIFDKIQQFYNNFVNFILDKCGEIFLRRSSIWILCRCERGLPGIMIFFLNLYFWWMNQQYLLACFV